MAFHTFVMSRSTNDVGLLLYRLFSFPARWLAASVWFTQRLSEALYNWYGNKSGVGYFINNKQWKMRPCALYLHISTLVSQLIADSSLLVISTKSIHAGSGSHGLSDHREIFPEVLKAGESTPE